MSLLVLVTYQLFAAIKKGTFYDLK